jgi:hypothetical protein
MVHVSAWVDDFMQMQCRVADLRQQHRQAQACKQYISSPAIECVSPRNVQPVLRLPARSHEHVEFACCGQGQHLPSLCQSRCITLLMVCARASIGDSIDHPGLYLQFACKSTPSSLTVRKLAIEPASRMETMGGIIRALLTSVEQIRETARLEGDHGRDKCQAFPLIRVSGTHRRQSLNLSPGLGRKVVSIKCSVYIAASVDGFIARPNGDINWLHKPEYASANEGGLSYNEFIATVDTLVMGRNSFEAVRAAKRPSASALARPAGC